MKRTLALVAIAMSAFALSPAMAAEATQPDLAVGSKWTIKQVDMYNGTVTAKWTNVIEGKSDKTYDIVRYDDKGAVLRKYSLTKNFGSATPTPAGNLGDGNLFQFPLKPGATWKSKWYWQGKNGEGYDDLTYTVQGEQEITVEAGKFTVIKVTGTGWWYNTSKGWSGKLDTVSYWSPVAGADVRNERTTAYGQNAPSKDAYELVSYELK